jgi:hypothetical protein
MGIGIGISKNNYIINKNMDIAHSKYNTDRSMEYQNKMENSLLANYDFNGTKIVLATKPMQKLPVYNPIIQVNNPYAYTFGQVGLANSVLVPNIDLNANSNINTFNK